ncbi:hypothetical protein P19_0113 [Aeromonas phage P19]|uniref:Uncharacterized protein n=1 Tax=Aeromonas phage AS-szw TaxID=2026114 RepID=A0A291LEU3_9CAUD|nr:hypothetical protein [Aeromonas phage AS-szw]UKM62601.1 hypothetical protein P19_0113 [Aeromonas phage P19]
METYCIFRWIKENPEEYQKILTEEIDKEIIENLKKEIQNGKAKESSTKS